MRAHIVSIESGELNLLLIARAPTIACNRTTVNITMYFIVLCAFGKSGGQLERGGEIGMDAALRLQLYRVNGLSLHDNGLRFVPRRGMKKEEKNREKRGRERKREFPGEKLY